MHSAVRRAFAALQGWITRPLVVGTAAVAGLVVAGSSRLAAAALGVFLRRSMHHIARRRHVRHRGPLAHTGTTQSGLIVSGIVLAGLMRGKVVRTTIADATAPCPLGRGNRQFGAHRPNQLYVRHIHALAETIMGRSQLA
ncbi:MAG: hypothetical protein ABW069_04995 [Duganella sp.]